MRLRNCDLKQKIRQLAMDERLLDREEEKRETATQGCIRLREEIVVLRRDILGELEARGVRPRDGDDPDSAVLNFLTVMVEE